MSSNIVPADSCCLGSLGAHKLLRGLEVSVIGAPLSQGQGLEGVARGPSVIRAAGLEEIVKMANFSMEDYGDIKVVEESYDIDAGTNIKRCRALGQTCENLFKRVVQIAEQKKMVLTLGGDHSVCSPTIKGLSKVYPNLAVVYVDAHADCNTPSTSPCGNYHGMSLAHALGWFGDAKGESLPGFEWDTNLTPLPEERVAIIGLRDVDKEERQLLLQSNINIYTIRKIDQIGIAKVVENALFRIDPYRNRPLHLSLDIDACDPTIAPGTGTKAPGGLTSREAHFICEELAETRRLVGMDLVEVNPDVEHAEEALHGHRAQVGRRRIIRVSPDGYKCTV